MAREGQGYPCYQHDMMMMMMMIYIITVLVVTISLGGFVADQMQYNLENTQ